MFAQIRRLLEMIRFSHTLFALPFALLGAVMAWAANRQDHLAEPFRWQELLGILICMVTARSAAMSFNRLVDRRIDALNPRTDSRHLPSGTLSTLGVTSFTVVCSVSFVAGTLLFLPANRLPLYCSVPVLLFLLGYSYAKRFTLLSHFWLGTALALSPLAAWVAIRAEIAVAPIVLGGAVLLWVAGFDILYACQDVEFDKRMRLQSVPAKLGVARALRVAAVCHAGMIGMLVLLAFVYPAFGWLYWTGVAAIAGLLIYEHALVRPDDLSRVNRAFFHVNAVVSVGLFVVGTVDLLFLHNTLPKEAAMTEYETQSLVIQEWGNWIAVGSAIVMVAVVVIALLNEKIAHWWRKPKLQLELADPSLTEAKRKNQRSKKRWYYILFVNNKNPLAIANEVRVNLAAIYKKGSSGEWEEEKPTRRPCQVHWSFPNHHPQYMKIGQNEERATFGCLPEPSQCMSSSWHWQLYVIPNNLVYKVTPNCPTKLVFEAVGTNAKSKPLTLVVTWNGQWSENESEMREHCTIEEISEP